MKVCDEGNCDYTIRPRSLPTIYDLDDVYLYILDRAVLYPVSSVGRASVS